MTATNPLMDVPVTWTPHSRDAQRQERDREKLVEEWRILHEWLAEVDGREDATKGTR